MDKSIFKWMPRKTNHPTTRREDKQILFTPSLFAAQISIVVITYLTNVTIAYSFFAVVKFTVRNIWVSWRGNSAVHCACGREVRSLTVETVSIRVWLVEVCMVILRRFIQS